MSNVTVDASVVSWTCLTADVRVVVAIHCWHRAAEVCSVAEGTRSTSSGGGGRLFGALSTRAAALFTLVIHRTVQVDVRRTPRCTVAVFTTYNTTRNYSP